MADPAGTYKQRQGSLLHITPKASLIPEAQLLGVALLGG